VNSKFDHLPDSGQPIVYVRPVDVDELPGELRAQARATGSRRLYALHSENGERLALVRERALAFVIARQNDLAPVNVH